MAEPTPGPRRAVAALLATVGSFLSFFTALSNLLVAPGLTATILPVPPRTLRPLIEPPGATAADTRAEGPVPLAACLAVARVPCRLHGGEPRPGALSHVYPYPFIDVAALGHQRVLGNMALLCGGFLVLGLMSVAVDRVMRGGPDGASRTERC